MQKVNTQVLSVGLVASLVFVGLGFAGLTPVFAATSPTLGNAASYSVLAGSIVTNAGGGTTTTTGDLGISPGIGVPPHYTGFPPGVVGGTIHDADGPGPGTAADAQFDNTAAFTALNGGSNADANCIGGIYPSGTDLTTLSPLGPGLYCSAGSFLLTGNLTLTGTSGVWVFKTVSTLITSPGSSVTGGDPCNIWWRVGSSATIDTTTAMRGNILALTSIALNNGANLNGRAMAQTGAVTLDDNDISGPVCAAAPPAGGGTPVGYISVVKNVINDNGGTKVVSDFHLFMDGFTVTPGVASTYFANVAHAVTETADPGYTTTFSGDCDGTGHLPSLPQNSTQICIVTNNDIGPAVVVPPVPPLISVVKVPSPLALPAGPGVVQYTYTLRNIGTVPVTNVTMVGDTCSPITLISGDTNNDAKLDLTETWVYTCSTTLTATHTNTVTATGWANGLSATDIASATVVVGAPIVPPLIHVTKVPNPLTLRAGGGMVTYTDTVTNPGTVALSNVWVRDDKCSPVEYLSGDTNADNKLDPSETWKYTCRTNLTQTTTNTVIATGVANGMTARDFALATVVVATAVVPALPNAGLPPAPMASMLLMGFLLVASVATIVGVRKLSK